MKKKVKQDLLQKDIDRRIDYEKEQRPLRPGTPKRHPFEFFMGVILFIVILSNLIYLLSSLLTSK